MWWAKSSQKHSCQNSSPHGSIIGAPHHILDSSRSMAPRTGGQHHHINPDASMPRIVRDAQPTVCIPGARTGPLKPSIESKSPSRARPLGQGVPLEELRAPEELLGILAAFCFVDCHRKGPASARFPENATCAAQHKIAASRAK